MEKLEDLLEVFDQYIYEDPVDINDAESLKRLNNICKVIAKGKYRGHDIMCMSYGTHPCGYVRLNRADKHYNEEYNRIPIECHGGLTFGRYVNSADPFHGFKDGYWIGWDYNHINDYNPLFYDNPFNGLNRKWTTRDIIEEAKLVIDQIIELNDK